jgi:hypothetical protein
MAGNAGALAATGVGAGAGAGAVTTAGVRAHDARRTTAGSSLARMRET